MVADPLNGSMVGIAMMKPEQLLRLVTWRLRMGFKYDTLLNELRIACEHVKDMMDNRDSFR